MYGEVSNDVAGEIAAEVFSESVRASTKCQSNEGRALNALKVVEKYDNSALNYSTASVKTCAMV